MANNKSAIKRNRQRDKRRLRNRTVLGAMRTAVKNARNAIETGDGDKNALVRAAVTRIDQAVTKGALTRRTGSRYISRLMTRAAR